MKTWYETYLDPIAPLSVSSIDMLAPDAAVGGDFGVAIGAFPPAF